MTVARHEETARLIYATDGVRFLLARAWKILIYPRSSLRKALLTNGIVAGLVTAISALDGVALTGNELMAPTFRFCLNELLKYLLTPPGYPLVTEALGAGLLQIIVSYGETANPDASDACSVYPHIQKLLGAITSGSWCSRRAMTDPWTPDFLPLPHSGQWGKYGVSRVNPKPRRGCCVQKIYTSKSS
ncbi:hypothetical protein DFH09DRAFT_1288909 [Mycena vulgaris]|nr:hypothetical protein DFH09DRAFT_1288909 [Mycena vulgaris]